jgi:hypothetical protein
LTIGALPGIKPHREQKFRSAGSANLRSKTVKREFSSRLGPRRHSPRPLFLLRVRASRGMRDASSYFFRAASRASPFHCYFLPARIKEKAPPQAPPIPPEHMGGDAETHCGRTGVELAGGRAGGGLVHLKRVFPPILARLSLRVFQPREMQF